MDAQGNFVVTWSSDGQDGSGWGVYAQRFDATGAAQGGEFQVNTTTQGDQIYSKVAMNRDGNFIITWQSYGQDGSGWGVYGQRYDATGVAQGGEFQVNTTTQGDQAYPTVAMDGKGDFVVTWSSKTQPGNPFSNWAIDAQRFDPNGVAQGGEFQVNSNGGPQLGTDRIFSKVSMDKFGDFLVSWQSYGQDGSGWGIFAQQYAPNGQSQGREFQVNTTAAGDQQFATIAMNDRGNAVAVWSGNGIGDPNGVFAQRFLTGGFGLGGTTTGDTLSTRAGDEGDSDGPAGAKADAGLPGAGSEQVAAAPGAAPSRDQGRANALALSALRTGAGLTAPAGLSGQAHAGLLDASQVVTRPGDLSGPLLAAPAPTVSARGPEVAPAVAAALPVSAAVTNSFPGGARSGDAPLPTSGTTDAPPSLRDERPRQADESQPLVPASPSAPQPASLGFEVEVSSGAPVGPPTPEQCCDAFFAGPVRLAGGSAATPLARLDAGDDRAQGLDVRAVALLGLVAGACWYVPREGVSARRGPVERSRPPALRPDA
jgi:hypothetical protein